MKKSIGLFVTITSLLFIVNPVQADGHAPAGLTQNKIFDSAKAAGMVITLKAGATLPSSARGIRVTYFITDGKVERIYPDGRKVEISYKAGDIVYFDKPDDLKEYAVKNIGKKEMKVWNVSIK